MSKLICFLGIGKYKAVTYQLDNRNAKPTKFIQAALFELLTPDKIVMLVTKEAKAEHGEALKSELHGLGIGETNIVWRDIPVATSDEGLWQLLGKISDALDEGEDVIFDITHSFRSQPFLIMLAAVYLRTAKRVHINGIYYGAFEAKEPPSKSDDTKPEDIAPIFNLTPFVQLLDLTTATAQFLNTGSSSVLSKMLTSLNPQSMLSENVSQISESLELLRPNELMTSAHCLAENINKEKDTILKQLPPVSALLNQIELEYGVFAMTEAEIQNHPEVFLKRQYEMILWYRQKHQFVHCVATAKEWITTFLCVRYGANPLDYWTGRKPIDSLPTSGRYRNQKGVEQESAFVENWNNDPLKKQINTLLTGSTPKKKGNLELNLSELRNDLMHVGFSRGAIAVNVVEMRVDAILAEIQDIARKGGVLEAGV